MEQHRIVPITLVVALVAPLGSQPAMSAAPTLCNDNETIVFSCQAGAHVVSICGSGDLAKESGYLQYRYGNKKEVELAYPALRVRPADAFTAGTMMFSGGGGAWLRFDKGSVRYTIFNAIGKWGPSGRVAGVAGVAVQKGGADLADISCQATVTSKLGPSLFKMLGLDRASSSQDFEIPDGFFQ